MTDFEIWIEDSHDILTELQRGSIVAKNVESDEKPEESEEVPKMNLMDKFDMTRDYVPKIVKIDVQSWNVDGLGSWP